MNGITSFLLVFFLACWIFVIGHQAGWDPLDPARYPVMRSTLIIAYTGAIISAGVLAVAVVAVFKK